MDPAYDSLTRVLELYDLYQRFSPVGPYRLDVFTQPADTPDWRASAQQRFQLLDDLLRGVSCLLANHLPGAAAQLLAGLWKAYTELDSEVQFRWLGRVALASVGGSEAMEEELAAVTQSPATEGAVIAAYARVLEKYLQLLSLRDGDLAAALKASGASRLPAD